MALLLNTQVKANGRLSQMVDEPLAALPSADKQEGRQPPAIDGSAPSHGQAGAIGAKKGTKQAPHAADSHGMHMSASEVCLRAVCFSLYASECRISALATYLKVFQLRGQLLGMAMTLMMSSQACATVLSRT